MCSILRFLCLQSFNIPADSNKPPVVLHTVEKDYTNLQDGDRGSNKIVSAVFLLTVTVHSKVPVFFTNIIILINKKEKKGKEKRREEKRREEKRREEKRREEERREEKRREEKRKKEERREEKRREEKRREEKRRGEKKNTMFLNIYT